MVTSKSFPYTHFDRRIAERHPAMFEYIAVKQGVIAYISYIINSNTRKAFFLPAWIKEQVVNPSTAVLDIAEGIKTGKNHDETVLNVLKWVHSNVEWTQDGIQWKAAEYWATANEITTQAATPYKDDCDGGSTLSYVLCRLKGVPASRILLFGGNVQALPTAPQEGHCWLGYRPDNYPLNWSFMDWCYNVNLSACQSRPKFYIKNQEILGDDVAYKSIWFAFNEQGSYFGLENVY